MYRWSKCFVSSHRVLRKLIKISENQNFLTKMDSKKSFSIKNSTFADLYPERRGVGKTFSVFEKMSGKANATSRKEICQNNIVSCMEMPMIKLMVSALESSGCPIDVSRHFACDVCTEGKDIQNLGGYDDENNQV